MFKKVAKMSLRPLEILKFFKLRKCRSQNQKTYFCSTALRTFKYRHFPDKASGELRCSPLLEIRWLCRSLKLRWTVSIAKICLKVNAFTRRRSLWWKIAFSSQGKQGLEIFTTARKHLVGLVMKILIKSLAISNFIRVVTFFFKLNVST